MRPVRFLLADDHDVLRMGLRAVVACKDHWQVCGEAVDGNDAVAKVLNLLQPDAVILDLMMPGMTGFEVARKIRQIAPSTKIIFFSLHNVPVSAKESGADAFVSKASGVRELLSTIERIMSTSQSALPRNTPVANPRLSK